MWLHFDPAPPAGDSARVSGSGAQHHVTPAAVYNRGLGRQRVSETSSKSKSGKMSFISGSLVSHLRFFYKQATKLSADHRQSCTSRPRRSDYTSQSKESQYGGFITPKPQLKNPLKYFTQGFLQ